VRHAEIEVGRGKHVHEAGVEPEAEARTKLDPPGSHPPEAALHRLHRILRRKQLGNLGFAEIERHRGAVV
jgi:hypothetical protein